MNKKRNVSKMIPCFLGGGGVAPQIRIIKSCMKYCVAGREGARERERERERERAREREQERERARERERERERE